jgi:YVTN family beta-propeller protein
LREIPGFRVRASSVSGIRSWATTGPILTLSVLLLVNVESGAIERVFETEKTCFTHALPVAGPTAALCFEYGQLEPSTAGVFPHPDNIHAFVTVRNDNAMLVINLETGETLARVEVGSSPDGVAYSPVQRR